MKVVKYLYILVFALLNNVIIAQEINKNEYLYSDYLNDISRQKTILKLLDGNNTDEALTLCEKITCVGFECKDKYYYLALCYKKSGSIKEAKYYYLKAIENGFNPYDILGNVLYNDFDCKKEDVDAAFDKYFNSIDIELRNKFALFGRKNFIIKDTSFLDSIITNIGWPGLSLVGHQTNCNKIIPKKNIFATLYYLDYYEIEKYFWTIYHACLHFDEDWRELENLLKHKMETEIFSNKKYIPLHFIYLNHNQKLQKETSLIQIVVLKNYICNNFTSIKLFSSKNISAQDANIILTEIKIELVKLGVDENLIDIESEQIELPENLYFSIIE